MDKKEVYNYILSRVYASILPKACGKIICVAVRKGTRDLPSATGGHNSSDILIKGACISI